MKNPAGFTLIEVMVVVVILGILAAIVAPNVMDHLSRARIEAAKSDIRRIETAFTFYKMDNFQYPSTESGIRALVVRPLAEAPNWRAGGYLKKLTPDPWGNEYLYRYDGEEIDIFTLGSDAEPGGEGEAADIHWRDL